MHQPLPYVGHHPAAHLHLHIHTAWQPRRSPGRPCSAAPTGCCGGGRAPWPSSCRRWPPSPAAPGPPDPQNPKWLSQSIHIFMRDKECPCLAADQLSTSVGSGVDPRCRPGVDFHRLGGQAPGPLDSRTELLRQFSMKSIAC